MPADAFLKIDGIPGESTDAKHKDQIEVLSYSHGVSQMGSASDSTAGGKTTGRCDHQDFSIVKELDKASPELNLQCCKGTHIKEMTLELCSATGDKSPYMRYLFEGVIISSISIGGGGGGLPTESVTFNYNKINWIYVDTDHETGKKKGEVKKWWSLKENKGG
ncbi:MAG: Hcp family type VI secretion system effector [Planctomycetota bacterium]|jgi:type VI secretion system Hcp family effector